VFLHKYSSCVSPDVRVLMEGRLVVAEPAIVIHAIAEVYTATVSYTAVRLS